MTTPIEAEAPSLIHQLGRLGFEKDCERRLALLRGVADLYLSQTVSPTLAEEYLSSRFCVPESRRTQHLPFVRFQSAIACLAPTNARSLPYREAMPQNLESHPLLFQADSQYG